MPADGVIQIAVDRYLLPSSVVRGSVSIVDGAGMLVAPELLPLVLYDPIARTITLAPPKKPWLTVRQPYKVVFRIPQNDSDLGLRAIDRATLATDQPLEYAFTVGDETKKAFEPTSLFCRDVLPIFAAKCNQPTCHGTGDRPAAGLILETSAGVGATALNRIAQGSNTGGRSGLAPAAGRIFGVDMPIVDPGNPSNSWLMYKIDLARLPTVNVPKATFACTSGLLEVQEKFVFEPLVMQAQRDTPEGERARLSDFILGREMPFPVTKPGGYGDTALTFDEREKVRLWIQSMPRGGTVPECGGCGDITNGGGSTDGGGAETSTKDAGIDAADAAADPDAADAADQ